MKKFLIIVFCLLIIPNVWAKGVLDGCYLSWDFSDTINTRVNVKAIGDDCDKLCQEQCKKFSAISNDWGELNQDVIDACQVDCRNGLVRSYEYRTESFDFLNYNNKKSASIDSACSVSDNDVNSANYIAYDTQQKVKQGDIIRIGVMGNEYEGGIVYLCGSKTQYLLPNPWSLSTSASSWGNTSANSSAENWHARNYVYADTGVDVRDGDYLTITFGHSFGSYCTGGECTISGTDCTNRTLANRGLQIRLPSTNNWQSTGQASSLPNDLLLCYVKNGDQLDGSSVKNAIENNTSVKWFGLGGNRWVGENGNDLNGKYNMFEFSGNISGFSINPTPLGIRHADNEPLSNWSDNNGGYMAKISAKGCAYKNGQRLQYAIVNENIDTSVNHPASWQWQDVGVFDAASGLASLYISMQGALYLRVKPLSANEVGVVVCNVADQECIRSQDRISNAHGPSRAQGYYDLMIKKEKSSNPFPQLSKEIEDIKNYLFGVNNQPGLVKEIFDQLVGNSGLLKAISATLALYIAFTGLAFMTGLSNISQQEGLQRLVKIGIVAALVNPNSWSFFNDFLFSLLINGSVELMGIFSTNLGGDQSTSVSDFFAKMLSTPWSVISSHAFWVKFLGLFLSGAFGCVIAIVVALAMGVYLWCMIKVILIYLVSLIMLSFLFILAPIYICFILFKYTKGMFDTWIKLMISYALQPVMIFAAVSLMLPILNSLMYTTLGFTVCPSCILSVGDYCLIPGWRTLHYGTIGTSAADAMPIAQIMIVLLFLLMTVITYSLCIYTSEIASLIATGQYVGSKLDEFTQSMPMTPNALADYLGADHLDSGDSGYSGYKERKRAMEASRLSVRAVSNAASYAGYAVNVGINATDYAARAAASGVRSVIRRIF